MWFPSRQITVKEKRRYIRREMRKERRKCFWSSLLEGKEDALKISRKSFVFVWIDMIVCSIRYTITHDHYLETNFYFLSKQQRNLIGESILKKKEKRFTKRAAKWNWYREYEIDRHFQIKYSGKEWERSAKMREKRRVAYKQRYNMGDDCLIQYDVDINRAHCLNGKIKIGNCVLLAKHVFIDYSGDATIKDDVQLTNGVIIETHHHAFHSDYRKKRKIVIPTSLVIEEGVVVGSRAIIMSSCHYIGKHARVGAGAVVTKDVPDYATVVGVPAKVIKVNAPADSLQ